MSFSLLTPFLKAITDPNKTVTSFHLKAWDITGSDIQITNNAM